MLRARLVTRLDRGAAPVVFDLGAYRVRRAARAARASQRNGLDGPSRFLDQCVTDADRVTAELWRTSVEFPELVKLLRIRPGLSS